MSPESYTKRIIDIARETSFDSMYPGDHYRALSNYLSQPARSKRTVRAQSVYATRPTHVVLHEFGVDQMRIRLQFKDPRDFQWYMNARDTTSFSRLVFLNGFSTPEWLSTLGSQFQVDPEFYRNHLSIRHGNDFFQQPSLPSGTKSITLRLTTLGSMTPCSGDLLSWQAQSSLLMKRYRQDLEDMNSYPGISIVREFLAFEGGMFSIEQDISIYLTTKGSQWTGKTKRFRIQRSPS